MSQPTAWNVLTLAIGISLTGFYLSSCGVDPGQATIAKSQSEFGVIAQALDNPLPPDGEPLPTMRYPNDAAYRCNNNGVMVEELPMAVTQACANQLNFQVLARDDGDICGRKGRKAWKECMERKLGHCVDMGSLIERRVPLNYCPDFPN